MSCRHPVALFAYRRADLLGRTLDALRLAAVPRIYAYVDGMRGASDAADHAAVLALIGRVDWAEVTVVAHERNLGLHTALHAGLDDFFAREACGVVVEEDIRLAEGAYAWMCEALDRYGTVPEVAAISAWAHRRFIPSDVTAPWFSGRWSCWGWAGWRRSWDLMREPADALVARLRQEGVDPAAYGEDVVTCAALGHWDAHFALACYGARVLTLYPPRSLADHEGIGGSAANQQHAGQWRAVAAAPLTESWTWPSVVQEHPESPELWRRAAVADAQPARPKSLARRLRRRLVVAWHRLSRAWTRWPEALALRATLALHRWHGAPAYDDGAPGVSTPVRYLWNDFLFRHRDAFYGRGLEIGDARMTASIGGPQMTRCDVVDIAARAGVDYVVDLQTAWSLPDGAFDVFLNQFTVHLVADDRAVLWHSLRTVQAEGTLLVNFPCAGSAPPEGAMYGGTHSFIWRAYTLPGVRTLLEELGIDDSHVELEPLGGAAAIASYLLGVPVEAMDRRVVESADPDAPLLIGARITKPVRWMPRWSPPAP